MRKELFILGMLLTLLVSSVAALVEYVDSTPRYEGSTNWAGYAPVSGTAIRTVKGVFDVPKAGCRKNWSAGLWAGLGGMSERNVKGSKLDQVGVYVSCEAGRESITPLYEQYPKIAQAVGGLVVKPGDSVLAAVGRGRGEVHFTLYDYTNNQSWEDVFPEKTATFTSAECILEEVKVPAGELGTGLSPVVHFAKCEAAGATNNPVSIYNANTKQVAGPVRARGGFMVTVDGS